MLVSKHAPYTLLVYCDGKLTRRALFTHRHCAQRAFDEAARQVMRVVDDPMRVEFFGEGSVLLDVCDGLWLQSAVELAATMPSDSQAER